MKLSLLITTLLIGLMVTTAHAGPTKGTVLAFPVIRPGTAVVIPGIELRGSHITDVYVTGEGGSIDCIVFNERGAIIGKDEGPTNSCRIRFTPKKTRNHTVMVTNVSPDETSTVNVVIQ